MTTKQSQLIICGSIALDRIMNFSGRYRDLIQPDKLHVLSLSILLDKLEETPGGVGANIAYSLALLGEHPILLGSAGVDASGYLGRLSEAGVDVGFVHSSSLPTASFNVMTDMEDNQVGGFYPGAMADAAALSLRQWEGQDVLVCVSAHDPAAMRAQTDECRELGLRLFYDPGQQVSNVSGEDLLAGAEAAEVLIASDYERSVLAQKIGVSSQELKSKVPVLITTYGKDGSLIEGTSVPVPIKVPIARPAQVVDPTGAGDGYRAGFLYGYLRQWDLDICGRLGATVASFIVEQHGTQRPFSRADIAKRYKDNFNEEIDL